MPSTSIRIDEPAIDSYRREKFLEKANAAFAALRGNPEAWSEEQQERGLWDRTTGDGLQRE
jgi:hypothetical protein